MVKESNNVHFLLNVQIMPNDVESSANRPGIAVVIYLQSIFAWIPRRGGRRRQTADGTVRVPSAAAAAAVGGGTRSASATAVRTTTVDRW